MLKFRDYQQKAFDDCVVYLEDKKNFKKSVVVAPTSFGKSLVIGAVAEYSKTPTLVLNPSLELLEQNFSKFEGFGGKGTIFSAGAGFKEISQTTFATPKSILPHIDKFVFLGVKTVVVDECHTQCRTDSIVDTIINKLGKDVKCIGFTASPVILRQGGFGAELKMLNRTYDSIFNSIIYCCQIQYLIENGFWAKLQYKILKQNFDSLEINSTGADFTDESVKTFYYENNIQEQIIEEWKEYKDVRKSILIFVPSIEGAEALSKLIPNSAALHSKTPKKQRELIISQFRKGNLQTIININVAGIGFDAPNIDLIIHTKPSNSIAVIYQNFGRGVRISDEKEDCLIIDMAGNVDRFGKIEDIKFENIENIGWCMTNNGYILTGQPLALPKIKIEDFAKRLVKKITTPEVKSNYGDVVITFGKYKGKHIKDVVRTDSKYLAWLLGSEDFNWKYISNGENVKKAITEIVYSSI